MQTEEKKFSIPTYAIWGFGGLVGLSVIVASGYSIYRGITRNNLDQSFGPRGHQSQEFGKGNMMGFGENDLGRGGMMGDKSGRGMGRGEAPTQAITDVVKSGLLKALDDEYKAYSTYGKIIDSLGETKPFSNIIFGEERHIQSLQSLLNWYSVDYPVNPYKAENITIGATKVENCKLALDLEKANVTMYDGLITEAKNYNEIAGTYDYLQNASKYNHIPALERCIANQ